MGATTGVSEIDGPGCSSSGIAPRRPMPVDEVGRCLWSLTPGRHGLDRPEALASALAPQADAAIIDTRSSSPRGSFAGGGPGRRSRIGCFRPPAPDAVADPWLRELTRSAATRIADPPRGVAIDWGVRLSSPRTSRCAGDVECVDAIRHGPDPVPPRSARRIRRWLAGPCPGGDAERHRMAFEAPGVATLRIISELGRPQLGQLRELAEDVLRGFAGGSAGAWSSGRWRMALARRDDLDKSSRRLGDLGRSQRLLADRSPFLTHASSRLPDLPSDKALPRWLAERAGIPVADLRAVQLALDWIRHSSRPAVARSQLPAPCPRSPTGSARAVPPCRRSPGMRRVLTTAARRHASAARPRGRCAGWNRSVVSRAGAHRERGLRAGSPGPGPADTDEPPNRSYGREAPRAPMRLLTVIWHGPDDRGPRTRRGLATLGTADRGHPACCCPSTGPTEAAWPTLADRLSSDLCGRRHRRPWLRQVTAAASRAPIPILLGGHTLVGPGYLCWGRCCQWSRTAHLMEPSTAARRARGACPIRPRTRGTGRRRDRARADDIRAVHGARALCANLGYYTPLRRTRPCRRFFLTAPETHPIFVRRSPAGRRRLQAAGPAR